jgi:hypothetical protein
MEHGSLCSACGVHAHTARLTAALSARLLCMSVRCCGGVTQVMGVVRQLQAANQPLEMNTIIDRLTRG